MSVLRTILRKVSVATSTAVLLLSSLNCVSADDPAPVEEFLLQGHLADGAAAMRERIDMDAGDHQSRFSLGIVQFLQAIEQLGQDQHRYGLLAGRARAIPFMRLPIPENMQSEEISYEKARAMVQRFVDGIQMAEQTLSSTNPEGVHLPLKLGLVHVDLNGDGEPQDEESLWYITQVLQNPRRPKNATPLKEFPIVFDGGDVAWLQGYCHVLSALGEIVLAHNWQDQFERTAHLFYPKVDSPFEYLEAEGTGAFMSFGAQNIVDAIAWVHTVNYEVVEPERMQKALMHLETVIRLSRQSWKLIEAETDDNLEWVPNAKQTSVMNGFNVGREVIVGWHEFLDEIELILQGRKLAPFWRGIKGGVTPFGGFPQNPDLGINVRRIFLQPTRFDLALWLQGTGFDPYLEKGEITSPKKWGKMMTSFRGNFFNFALWFN